MKKKLRIESLEKRYLMHAAPVDHQSHLSAMQGGVALDGVESAGSRNIIVKDWSQFKAADFADKIYNDVTIDNKTGWFNGKSGAFLGFNKLEVEGNLKGSTLEILGLNPTVNNAVQVDGNMVNSSVVSPAAQVEKVEVKGGMEIGKGFMVLTNALGSLEVGGKLLVDGGIIETTSKDLGKVEATKGITLQGGLIGSTSGIGEIESMGKIMESKGSSIFAWSGIGAIKGKELDLNGVVYAYKGITLEGKDGVVIGKEGLIESKRGVVSVKSDDEILNKGVVEGVGVMMDSKGDDPYSLAVENEGTIRALGEGSGEGKVILKAEQNAVQDEGKLIARDGDKGGEVEIEAPWAVLWGKGTVDVRGKDGGGKVILQGTNAVVGPQDVIEASAVDKGNGGQIRILADNTTVVGNLLANGGKDGGSGGSVNIGGLDKLNFGGVIQAESLNKGNGGQIQFTSAGPTTVNGDLFAFGGKDSGNGGSITISAGSELYSNGLWNVSAPDRGHGGTVSLISSGENSFGATLLDQGGRLKGNGGIFFMQSGWIGTDLNGIVDLNARGKGNGGIALLTSMGQTAITGIISAEGGKNGGNAGNITIQSDGTLYQVGQLDLGAPSGTSGTPNLEAPEVSHDLFSAGPAKSPVQHLFVIIGENHSFDNYFGTYLPRQGQTVQDLLTQGIVNPDGSPGPNFSLAAQAIASDTTKYQLDPTHTGLYAHLPQPNTTYAVGQIPDIPDPRFPSNLPNGPFPINKYVGYNSYVGDPVHRFFQMYQQTDLGKHDLYTWVAQTVGIGGANSAPAPTPSNTYQGAVQMGFYNNLGRGGSFIDFLASSGTINDNFHQSIMGGTGANHYGLVSGGLAAVFNVNGKPATPFANQIENPNPAPGTNNFYTNDGYRGGSYINPSDPQAPGIKPILQMLDSLPYKPFMGGDFKPGEYYLVNNYNPGYYANGTPRPIGPNDFNVPPQNTPNIMTDMSGHGVSWNWFSQGWNNGKPSPVFDDLGDPGLFFTNIMKTSLKNNLQGMQQFWTDMKSGNFPAVSFIKPNDINDGHPASSNPALFENFVQNIIQHIQANKKLWYSSAVMITMDESGGYYDNGYIQPLTVFGDGPRIPLIVVSPYAQGGFVDHTYTDHVSIDKYIEANWGIPPIASNTIDNLPNPVTNPSDPYIPENRPAIGDLTTSFHYSTLTPTDKGNIPSAGQFPVGEQKELNGKGGSSPAIQMVPRSQTGGLDLANEDSLGVFRV
ncbi:alkaline phosphatase family protein [Candidatus Methylacidiphilum infernorum]|uniref:Phospholipase C n=1 Tax=Methylacidiphilum infernorum (isolate V4) TaxID=481448 RepID=B3DX35_METI4|nr:alkaline phosphatase family protein [Candidatus Methylacidiphilum infernorum]ACD82175.1 Phospholipase C [Methylacidiphilum infernorum V4]